MNRISWDSEIRLDPRIATLANSLLLRSTYTWLREMPKMTDACLGVNNFGTPRSIVIFMLFLTEFLASLLKIDRMNAENQGELVGTSEEI